MKYTLPLAIGAIGLLLGSCASERTTFVKGNAIEWQSKNTSPIQEPTAAVIAETAATTESASLDNSALPLEIASPVTEQPAVSEAPAVVRAEKPASTSAAAEVTGALAASETAASVENAAATTTATPTTPAPVYGGSNQVIAAVLAFFLGGLGIHRFYLGYTWQGIVQLLTGGGFLIWALIDFIRICMGKLEPKDGSYD